MGWKAADVVQEGDACLYAERRVVQNILERDADITSAAEKTRSKGLSHHVDIHVTWRQETQTRMLCLFNS